MDHPFHEPKPSAAVPKSFVALIGEPSLADAMTFIESDTGLPQAKRRHWLCSMRVIARGIGLPPRIAACAPDRAPASPPAPQCGSHGTRNQKPRQSQVQCPRRDQSFCRRQQHTNPRRAIVPRVVRPHEGNSGGQSQPASERNRALLQLKEKKTKCDEREARGEYFAFRHATSLYETGVARQRELMRAWNRCVDTVPGWPPFSLTLPALSTNLRRRSGHIFRAASDMIWISISRGWQRHTGRPQASAGSHPKSPA